MQTLCRRIAAVRGAKYKLITIHTLPQMWNKPPDQLTHIWCVCVCGAVPGQSDDSTSVFNVIYENYEQSLEAFYCYYNINTISEGVWIQKDFRFVGRFIEHFFVSFCFLVTVFIASLFCSALLLIFLDILLTRTFQLRRVYF